MAIASRVHGSQRPNKAFFRLRLSWLPWDPDGCTEVRCYHAEELPSGKRLHNYGKSPILMGKLTINGYVKLPEGNSNSDLAKWSRVVVTTACEKPYEFHVGDWKPETSPNMSCIIFIHFSCFIFHFSTHSRCLLNHCQKSCTIWAQVVAHGSDG